LADEYTLVKRSST